MITIQELLMSVDIGLIYGMISVGIYITFRTINFADLSCDGSFALGACVSAVMVKYGINPYLTLFAAFLSGGFAGFLTGVLNIKLKITDLLSGIIVAFMLYSVNLRIMDGAPNITISDHETIFSSGNSTVILFCIVFSIATFLIYLLLSDFGLALRSTGYNKKFSCNVGVNTAYMTIVGLVMSNSLIGLGGALFTQYQGFCDISQGVGTLVIGLASVVIGEKVLPFKKEAIIILSCIMGSILYRIFIGMALHVNVSWLKTQDLNLITGFIVIAIMALTNRGKYAAIK